MRMWKVNSDVLTNEEKIESLIHKLKELDEDIYPFSKGFYLQEEWNKYIIIRTSLIRRLDKLKEAINTKE